MNYDVYRCGCRRARTVEETPRFSESAPTNIRPPRADVWKERLRGLFLVGDHFNRDEGIDVLVQMDLDLVGAE